jgi:hypothetical protein
MQSSWFVSADDRPSGAEPKPVEMGTKAKDFCSGREGDALAFWQRVERCFQPSEGNQFLLQAQARPDPVIAQIVE